MIYKRLFLSFFLLFLIIPAIQANVCNTKDNYKVKLGTVNKIMVEGSCIVNNELPKSLFGFNMKWDVFQNDFVKTNNFDALLKLLEPFQGSLFRYPGGLVSNHFIQYGVGTSHTVFPNKEKILFDHDKFIGLIQTLDAKGVYVLNLLGGGSINNQKLLSEEWLKKYTKSIAKKYSVVSNDNISYQLGNELDRSKYEWKPDVYYKRSMIAVNILNQFGFNHIVGFGRHFNWNYKHRMGQSTWESFTQNMMKKVNNVTDISLHFYYDSYFSDAFKDDSADRFSIHKTLMKIDKVAQFINNDNFKKTNILITEHSRQFPKPIRNLKNSNKKQMKKEMVEFSSSMTSALSSADFIIGLSQMPVVKGACWQSLNANGRRLIFVTKAGKLLPGKVYWMMKLLRESYQPVVLSTKTQSIKNKNSDSDYSIRSVVLKNKNTPDYSIWLINRSKKTQKVNFNIKTLAGMTLPVHLTSLTDDGRSFTEKPNETIINEKVVISAVGEFVISIPPLSVNVAKISGEENVRR